MQQRVGLVWLDVLLTARGVPKWQFFLTNMFLVV